MKLSKKKILKEVIFYIWHIGKILFWLGITISIITMFPPLMEYLYQFYTESPDLYLAFMPPFLFLSGIGWTMSHYIKEGIIIYHHLVGSVKT
jgi:hypothetical protein